MPNGQYYVEVRPKAETLPCQHLLTPKELQRVKFTGSGAYLIVNGLEVAIET